MKMKQAKKMNKVRWSLRRVPGGYDGTVWLPAGRFGMIPVTAHARGPRRGRKATASKAKAIRSAAGLAEKVLENPFLSTLMPPGTHAAVKGIKMISKYGPSAVAKSGKLIGKGAKRLLSALKFW